ncbi:MAG: hypothetical protein ABEJ83_00265 [Candidatus Nanohaloarchaea archaeon]
MVQIREEAKNDLSGFEDKVMNKILDSIEKYLKGSVANDKVEVIQRPSYDAVFHRLKLTEGEMNHRVYFDYKDSEIQVFAVRHRDFAYSSKDIKEAVKRLQELQKQ